MILREITIIKELNGVCEIGQLMSEGSCHKTWYKNEKGYKQLCELSDDDMLTLFWKAGCKSYLEDGSLVINNLIKVCFHHYCMYLACFDKKQKNCNNPFDVHAKSRKRKQRRGTHLVSLKTAQQLEGKFCLIPGEKLCRECWMHRILKLYVGSSRYMHCCYLLVFSLLSCQETARSTK